MSITLLCLIFVGTGILSPTSAMGEEDDYSQLSENHQLDRHFYIILASHRKKVDAEKSLNKYKEKVDFRLQLKEVEIEGESWHRVSSSFFTSVSEVELRLEHIKADVTPRAWYFSTTEFFEELDELEVGFSGQTKEVEPQENKLATLDLPISEDDEEGEDGEEVNDELGPVDTGADILSDLPSALVSEAHEDSVYPFKHFGRLEPIYSQDD